MAISRQQVEQRMKHFETFCREKGIKLTHQRIEIFRAIATADEHPNAGQVYEQVRQRIPTVSLDTVYRTLWRLNDLGLIETVGLSREQTRFDANLTPHHHFVCRRCGFTRDFSSPELEAINLPESVTSFGAIEKTQVEVTGLCRKCMKKGG